MSTAAEGNKSVSSFRRPSRGAWQPDDGTELRSIGDEPPPAAATPQQQQQPPQPPAPTVPRLKLAREEEPRDDDDPDVPDHPQFWIAAATTIGAACFVLLVVALIVRYGQLSSLTIWIVFAVGTVISYLVPCMFYMCTSQHYWVCGKIGDGLLGGLPYLFFGAGVIYLYTILGMMLKRTQGAKFETKLVIFATVPLFMALMVPLFVFMLHVQRTEVDPNKKVLQAVAPIDPKKPQASKGRCKITFNVFRHLFFGGIVACCVSAYAILPIYALCWICIGLYRLGKDVHIAVPIVIIVAVIVLFVIVWFFCPAVAMLPFKAIKGWYTMPMYGWGPRVGPFIPRYDNFFTIDRKLAEHNDLVDTANKKSQKGLIEEAKQQFELVKASKQNMELMGIMTVPDVPKEKPSKV